jgi:hypothetical protein
MAEKGFAAMPVRPRRACGQMRQSCIGNCRRNMPPVPVNFAFFRALAQRKI